MKHLDPIGLIDRLRRTLALHLPLKAPDGRPRAEWDAEGALINATLKCWETGEPQQIPEKYWEIQRRQGKPISATPRSDWPGGRPSIKGRT